MNRSKVPQLLDHTLNYFIYFLTKNKADFLKGVLRFFRVHLPRQFLHEASVISLIYAAEQEKISSKREDKLRKEWLKMQDEKETPLQRLQRENKRLQDRTIRLDFENDQVKSEKKYF